MLPFRVNWLPKCGQGSSVCWSSYFPVYSVFVSLIFPLCAKDCGSLNQFCLSFIERILAQSAYEPQLQSVMLSSPNIFILHHLLSCCFVILRTWFCSLNLVSLSSLQVFVLSYLLPCQHICFPFIKVLVLPVSISCCPSTLALFCHNLKASADAIRIQGGCVSLGQVVLFFSLHHNSISGI